MNLKITLGECFPPAAKASVMGFEEIGGEHKLGKITMVGKYLDHVPSLSKIVSVMGESMDDGVKFLIVDVPILLGGVEFVMKKEKGVPPVVVFLFEDAGVGFIGGVR